MTEQAKPAAVADDLVERLHKKIAAFTSMLSDLSWRPTRAAAESVRNMLRELGDRITADAATIAGLGAELDQAVGVIADRNAEAIAAQAYAEKLEAGFRDRDATIAAKDATIAAKDAEIERLNLALIRTCAREKDEAACVSAAEARITDLQAEVGRVREFLRGTMLKQRITEERDTYSDGFAQGLAFAIGSVEHLIPDYHTKSDLTTHAEIIKLIEDIAEKGYEENTYFEWNGGTGNLWQDVCEHIIKVIELKAKNNV